MDAPFTPRDIVLTTGAVSTKIFSPRTSRHCLGHVLAFCGLRRAVSSAAEQRSKAKELFWLDAPFIPRVTALTISDFGEHLFKVQLTSMTQPCVVNIRTDTVRSEMNTVTSSTSVAPRSTREVRQFLARTGFGVIRLVGPNWVSRLRDAPAIQCRVVVWWQALAPFGTH